MKIATFDDAITRISPLDLAQIVSSEPGNYTLVDGTGKLYTSGTSAAAYTLLVTVRNQTGVALNPGQAVYLSGSAGNKPLATLAQANVEATSSTTFAVIRDVIPNNQNGIAVVSGDLENIDTLSVVEGSIIWLSPSVAGGWTAVKPTAPNHAVFLGIVTRSHQTQGSISVRIVNGFEIGELHDVSVVGAVTGQSLVLASSGIWVAGDRLAHTFETIAHNLKSSDLTYAYNGDGTLHTKSSSVVTMTYAYLPSGDLSTKTLSGTGVPSGVAITKTYTYADGNLTSVSYST